MKTVIGIITYSKNGVIQLLESPLIDSIRSQARSKSMDFNIVVFINSESTSIERNQLAIRLNSIGFSYDIIGGECAYQVPKARNMLLEHIAFSYGMNVAVFMPDDDDKFFDEWALMAIHHAVNKYGVDTPILTSFNGLKGNIMPNNRRIFPNPESIYQECAGYFNWNAIYGIKYFVKNQFSFPEFLDPPHRSHDTIVDLKNAIVMKNEKFIFLANCIMDYKYPEGANTLSTRTKRPDSPLFDAMEYLYSDNNVKRIDKIIFYDAMYNNISEISDFDYNKLRFRSKESKSDLSKLLLNKKYLIDFMGRIHEDIKVKDYKNLNGIDYVILVKEINGYDRSLAVKLDVYFPIDSAKGNNLYKRYLDKELDPSKNYDDYFYISVR